MFFTNQYDYTLTRVWPLELFWESLYLWWLILFNKNFPMSTQRILQFSFYINTIHGIDYCLDIKQISHVSGLCKAYILWKIMLNIICLSLFQHFVAFIFKKVCTFAYFCVFLIWTNNILTNVTSSIFFKDLELDFVSIFL